ncbi:hypothetical protein ACW9I5_31630, partial [Pseudomonas azotoformans]
HCPDVRGMGVRVSVESALNDRNPRLKWIKRSIALTVVAVLIVKNAYWIAGTLLSLGSAGLVIWALSKSPETGSWAGYSRVETECEEPPHQEADEGMWRDGPEGWGLYRVDDVRIDF